MKIFSLKYQILAGVIASAYGKSNLRYTNAMEGIMAVFHNRASHFWRQEYVENAVKVRYPKTWRKWIDRKSGELPKIGKLVKRPFERCGTDHR